MHLHNLHSCITMIHMDNAKKSEKDIDFFLSLCYNCIRADVMELADVTD